MAQKATDPQSLPDHDPEDDLGPEDLIVRIRMKAKELYMRRGQQKGRDWEDWFEAERMVLRDLRKRGSKRAD
jgi:hypothetical protein